MFSAETRGSRRSGILFAIFSCVFLVSGHAEKAKTVECFGGAMSLTSIYTPQNESVRGEIGFNTTFPLLIRENGTILLKYPNVDPNKFWTELNFTEAQRDPLKNLSLVTNSSQVGVHYVCNFTTLNCTVRCTFASDEEGLGNTDQSVGGFCADGFDTRSLKDAPNITDHWVDLCITMLDLETDEPSRIQLWLRDDNQTIVCDYNTSVPIPYEVRLWGGGLNTTTVPCVQNWNRTVVCHIEANVTGVQNVSDILCTVLTSSWNTRFARRLYDEEDDFYLYYSDDEGDGKTDGEQDEEETLLLQLSGGKRSEGNGPGPDVGGGGSSVTVVVVVACIGLFAASVGAMLSRKRPRKPVPERAVYRPQLRAHYHPVV